MINPISINIIKDFNTLNALSKKSKKSTCPKIPKKLLTRIASSNTKIINFASSLFLK
jgi:hypothetical protein